MSGVKDMSRAFSMHRNEANTALALSGNLNAKSFTGAGLEKWTTESLATLSNTFYGAAEMNANLGRWTVSAVTDLQDTFRNAVKFGGTGLETWKPGSATTLFGTFYGAAAMNTDVIKWDTSKVTSLHSTFRGASAFDGTGLTTWFAGWCVVSLLSRETHVTPRVFSDHKPLRANI